MSGTPIYTLSGIDNTSFGAKTLLQEFDVFEDTLNGEVNTSGQELYAEFLDSIKQHLVNTRNHIAQHPEHISQMYDSTGFIPIIDFVLSSWDNAETRTTALQQASILLNRIEKTDSELSGLFSKIKKGVDNVFDKINEALPEVKKAVDKAGDTKVGEKFKDGRDTVIKVGYKVEAKTQEALAKTKATLKKIGAAIVQYNPLSLIIKGGLLAGMKVNFYKIASKIWIAYYSKSEATKAGYSASQWDKAKHVLSKIENIYVNQLKGKQQDLKYAVLHPLKQVKYKKRTLDGLEGLEGLGEAATGTAVAASLPVWAVIAELVITAGLSVLAIHKAGQSLPSDTGDPTVMELNDQQKQGLINDQATQETQKLQEEQDKKDQNILALSVGIPLVLGAAYFGYKRFSANG